MGNIEFTVLMCTYKNDDPFLLEKAIESVFSNSIKPNFFILTIDGPIPKKNQQTINKLIKRFPIEINNLLENNGLANALNSAIKLVKTKWIARADSDDINLKHRFKYQVEIARKNFDVIGCNILEKDYVNNSEELIKKMPTKNKEIIEYAKRRNPINHMTVFYKTDIIKYVGGYPDIYLREDYGLWSKLIYSGALFHNIDKVLVEVNAGENLYLRRSGIKNVLSEFRLQMLLSQCKIKPFLIALFDFFIRTFLLLLPLKILKKVYINKLRTKK